MEYVSRRLPVATMMSPEPDIKGDTYDSAMDSFIASLVVAEAEVAA